MKARSIFWDCLLHISYVGHATSLPNDGGRSEAIRRLVEFGLKAKKMTKTPGELEPPKPITKAERDARKAFRQGDAEKAMTEHEIAQKAFSNNANDSRPSGWHERPRNRRRRNSGGAARRAVDETARGLCMLSRTILSFSSLVQRRHGRFQQLPAVQPEYWTYCCP
jgi:hypothetical protein